jgi:hypothetical protein
MEGEFAERNPLTLAQCAKIAEESLTQRLQVSLFMLIRLHFKAA